MSLTQPEKFNASYIDQTFLELQKNRWSFATTDTHERLVLLKKLKASVQEHREEIAKAIFADFKKPIDETELTEIHPVLDEINFAIRNLSKWMKPKKVKTPMTLLGTSSFIQYEAKGVVLIISPWNYPFQLAINPLVAAIAAGNVAIVRPSEKTPHTGLIVEKILQEVFSSNIVAVIRGELESSKHLLELPFDHIFFTGSTQVGKIVAEKAAKHLASVTLELGGKSPVVIDQNCDLSSAVRKIVWGKHLNAGQTCVAPDYVFVHKNIYQRFIETYKIAVSEFFGETEKQRKDSLSLARIVDKKGTERLGALVDQSLKAGAKSEIGGEYDVSERYLAPTLLTHISPAMPVMQEELFGPILPVLTFEDVQEVIHYIQSHDKPLALYCFSDDKAFQEKLLKQTSSGGLVFNQVLAHLANHHLPFGGVGGSGQGNYHGEFGFRALSHERAVMRQSRFGLLSLYFPPYGTWLSDIAFKLLRLFQ